MSPLPHSSRWDGSCTMPVGIPLLALLLLYRIPHFIPTPLPSFGAPPLLWVLLNPCQRSSAWIDYFLFHCAFNFSSVSAPLLRLVLHKPLCLNWRTCISFHTLFLPICTPLLGTGVRHCPLAHLGLHCCCNITFRSPYPLPPIFGAHPLAWVLLNCSQRFLA